MLKLSRQGGQGGRFARNDRLLRLFTRQSIDSDLIACELGLHDDELRLKIISNNLYSAKFSTHGANVI